MTETAASAGGRRRAALLQRSPQASSPSPPAPLPQPSLPQVVPPPLTAADVESLRRDRSPEARTKLAAKLGRQFDALATGSAQGLAAAVLHLLVHDLAKEVRQALALAVGASPNLPPAVAGHLAGDVIEVAEPVLRHSPVLTDEDLIRVVRTNAMQYALAVAGRARLSEAVCQALVETGEEQVVVRLLDNAGASLAQSTLQRILADFGASDAVHARFIRRPELPYELVEQLVGIVGDRLEWRLIQERRLAADEAKAIMDAVRERVAISFTARTHADGKLHQHLREQFAVGALGHERLLAFLRDGEIASLELGLAVHARLDPLRVRRLLYHEDRRHMAALCLAAGFATAHYIMLRVALELAEAALTSRPGARQGYNAETIRFLHEQYERLRRDEPLLRQLLGR